MADERELLAGGAPRFRPVCESPPEFTKGMAPPDRPVTQQVNVAQTDQDTQQQQKADAKKP